MGLKPCRMDKIAYTKRLKKLRFDARITFMLRYCSFPTCICASDRLDLYEVKAAKRMGSLANRQNWIFLAKIEFISSGTLLDEPEF